MSFETALAFALQPGHEGAYGEPPQVEQPTNHGITQATYDRWNAEHNVAARPVKEITDQEVRDIYYQWYWEPCQAGELTDQWVGDKFFDFYINMPPKAAVEVLQLACGDCGHPTIIDGAMGPNTIASANSCDPDNLLVAIRIRLEEYYRALVNRKPELGKYLASWLRRAES